MRLVILLLATAACGGRTPEAQPAGEGGGAVASPPRDAAAAEPQEPPRIPEGVVAWWEFASESAHVVEDLTGQYDGTLVGDAKIVRDAPPGCPPGALELDRDGDWMKAAALSPDPSTWRGLTIEGYAAIFDDEHDGRDLFTTGATCAAFYLSFAPGPAVGAYHDCAAAMVIDEDHEPERNHWFHVAGVWDPADPDAPWRVYLDHQLVGSGSIDVASPSEGGMAVGSLADGHSAHFNGRIAALRVWNRAVDPGEMLHCAQ
ncbi:MAG TPA: LamG-like jellyroll fold domain-containing protein [Kofleriaceae bacterium]|nr:LamG-like jellyroll fold domain-containing protein [Kofleriaceae bacterium]